MRSVFVALLLACSLLLPSLGWAENLPVIHDEPGRALYVWKGERQMVLADTGREVRRFRVVLGGNPVAPKRVRGDKATPEGRYFVREKNPASRFHRFLGLNYPNLADADRGLDDGFIDDGQWADIFFANMQRRVPPPATRLGGRVGIHGYGGRPELPIDWTEGCIAVTDEEIDYLFNAVAIDTPVIIYE